MLGYIFIFEEHAKKVKEKATGCSLETLEVPLNAVGHVLT